MAQAFITLLAGKQLAPQPDLHAKVRDALGGILDTAIEARKLHGDPVPMGPPISMRVDGHVVWYTLDLDRPSATILVVELGRRFDPCDLEGSLNRKVGERRAD